MAKGGRRGGGGGGGGGGNTQAEKKKEQEKATLKQPICIRCPDTAGKNVHHDFTACNANPNDPNLWSGFSTGAQTFSSNNFDECRTFLDSAQRISSSAQPTVITLADFMDERLTLKVKGKVVAKSDLAHAFSVFTQGQPAGQPSAPPLQTSFQAPVQTTQVPHRPASGTQVKKVQQKACSKCGRTGHPFADCPYYNMDNKVLCSNCGVVGHFGVSCEQNCQIRGCKTPHEHHTWLHPDPASKLSDEQRAQIIGFGAKVAKSDDALENPDPKSIYSLVTNPIDRPITEYACYKGETDSKWAPNGNAPSVVTNYVKVDCTLEKIYVYSMTFQVPSQSSSTSPPSFVDMKQRGERKRVFSSLLQQAPLHGRQDYATDFTTLWTGSPLLNQQSISLQDVQYTKQSGKQASVHTVQFRLTSVLDFANDPKALSGPVRGDHNPNELIRALNGMVTKCITEAKHDKLFDCGTNMFFIKGSEVDIKGIYLQRGYFTSVRPGAQSVLLNVNVTHGAFLKPMLVSDFIDEVDKSGQLRRENTKAVHLLKGHAVRIIYKRKSRDGVDKDSNRTKVISSFGDVPYIQQFEGEGKMWTVMEWFESQGLPIEHPKHPSVNVGLTSKGADGSSRALWVPAEYLEIEPNQALGKQLGPFHMEKMKSAALQPPAVNQASIEEEGLLALGLGDRPQPLALPLQMTAGEHLLQIPATHLNAPILSYGNMDLDKVKDASWNLKFAHFKRPAMQLGSVPCMFDLRPAAEPPAYDIATSWLKQCKVHNLLTPGLEPIEVTKENAKVLTQPIAKHLSFFQVYNIINGGLNRAAKTGCVFIIVLLPPTQDPTNIMAYESVKRIADTKFGIHTVCITQGKAKKPNDSLFSNLLLKQNLKAEGSQNHAVMASKGVSSFQSISSDTLVIGVDVVHPGGFHPSIAAMVGSIEADFATFPGHVRLQPARKEILTTDNMREMADACITAYGKKRGKLPRRIIYFRDGVGEDQYQAVVDHELPELVRAYPAGEASPTITAIIVGKRHNTRFFAPADRMSYGDRNGHAPSDMSLQRIANTAVNQHTKQKIFPNAINGNVKPGLLVDQVITQPDMQAGYNDFFLQSHAALAGTAKSAHYVVVRNDRASRLTQAEIQRLSHAFCYNYARATKGVSYCSPAYYADRLCDRAHHYLRNYFALNPPEWTKTQAEKDAGALGEEQFRERVRDDIASDPAWKPADRSEPWHPNLDNVMFWL